MTWRMMARRSGSRQDPKWSGQWLGASSSTRETGGAWFATVSDPDGNYLQIIELTEAYWALRAGRFAAARNGEAAPQV